MCGGCNRFPFRYQINGKDNSSNVSHNENIITELKRALRHLGPNGIEKDELLMETDEKWTDWLRLIDNTVKFNNSLFLQIDN